MRVGWGDACGGAGLRAWAGVAVPSDLTDSVSQVGQAVGGWPAPVALHQRVCPPAPPSCPPGAAYDFHEEKQEEEGDADLAKIEQLKALMGGCQEAGGPAS